MTNVDRSTSGPGGAGDSLLAPHRRAGRVRSAVAGARIAWKLTFHGRVMDEVITRTPGYQEAYQVCMYIAMWGLFLEHNAREPRSERELHRWLAASKWSGSHQTVLRWGTLFREAFPEYETPGVIWGVTREVVTSDRVEVAGMEVGLAEVEQ